MIFATEVSASPSADASAWDGDSRAAVRLIAGSAAPTEQNLRAGIEIRLAPGWKTYWRYPGDSGVPPRFDFGNSQNVGHVDVLWPAPKSFADGNGKSIGYSDDVILPLHIRAANPKAPVRLRLNLDYAVCAKLCVPATARLELNLPVTSSAHEAALAASEARVPTPAVVGNHDELAIVGVTEQLADPRPRLVVDVSAPPNTPVELFAEGPQADWALPIPEPLAPPTGLHRFAFELDGLPPGSKIEGARIKLTAVAPDKAVEVTFELH